MTRYFLHSPSGNIYKYDDDNDVAVPDQEEYTEVQIVPLDAVVIEGPLPIARQMNSKHPDLVLTGVNGSWSRDFVERCFLQIVAAKKWFDENPAVDQAQIEAVTDILFTASASWNNGRLARHLVGHGVRVEPKS